MFKVGHSSHGLVEGGQAASLRLARRLSQLQDTSKESILTLQPALKVLGNIKTFSQSPFCQLAKGRGIGGGQVEGKAKINSKY